MLAGADTSSLVAKGSSSALSEEFLRLIFSSGLSFAPQSGAAHVKEPAGDQEQPQGPWQEDSQVKPVKVPPALWLLRAPCRSHPFTSALPFTSCH